MIPFESVMVKLLAIAGVLLSPSNGLYKTAPEIITPIDPSDVLVTVFEYVGVLGIVNL